MGRDWKVADRPLRTKGECSRVASQVGSFESQDVLKVSSRTVAACRHGLTVELVPELSGEFTPSPMLRSREIRLRTPLRAPVNALVFDRRDADWSRLPRTCHS